MKRPVPLTILALSAAALCFAEGGTPSASPRPTEAARAVALLAYGSADDAPADAMANFGATPTTPEVKQRLQQWVESAVGNEELRARVAARAFHDAWGRAPSDTERTPLARGGAAYFQLLQSEFDKLREDEASYRQMLQRAYQFVLAREPFDLEYAYWSQQDKMPYLLVVGCLENWARRNQPGLMVTSGTARLSPNSRFLETLTLSPALAEAIRVATGYGAEQSTDWANPAAFGRTAIGPGASAVIVEGHQHLLVAGRASRH